jgi:TolB protein
MGGILRTVAALALTAGVAACSGSPDPPSAAPVTTGTDTAKTDTTRTGTGTRGTDSACDPLPDLPHGRIVYTQTREDGTEAVYLMKPDGTDRRCLIDTAGPDSFPAWSPDGRWLAFIGGATEGDEDIYVVRADGTLLQQLTDTDAVEEQPEWSPDGTRIGYTSSNEEDSPSTIHVMARDGSDDTVVITDSGDVGHPELQDWSPDSKSLLFGNYHGRAGLWGLWTVRVEGTHRRFLRGGPGDYGSGAVYSPDGRWLVFQADLNGGCIYKSDASVTHVVRLTQGCAEGFILTWSPDGRWIAWAGGPHGPADAQVMRSDGTQVHTIADGSDVASMDWQPSTFR